MAATAASLKRICVFCGSKHGASASYTAGAQALARTMVQHRIGLVYGGGTVGLMGEIARAVRRRGRVGTCCSAARRR